jgi:hypothetical protein
MSIIKNFRNPWEDDNWVLQTDVLDTSVLDTDVLNKLSEELPNSYGHVWYTFENGINETVINKAINYSKQLFKKNNINWLDFANFSYKKETWELFNESVSIYDARIIIENRGSYTYNAFSSYINPYYLSDNLNNYKKIGFDITHEIIHQYLMRIGWVLWGWMNYLQPHGKKLVIARPDGSTYDSSHFNYKRDGSLYLNMMMSGHCHDSKKGITYLNSDVQKLIPYHKFVLSNYYSIMNLDNVYIASQNKNNFVWDINDYIPKVEPTFFPLDFISLYRKRRQILVKEKYSEYSKNLSPFNISAETNTAITPFEPNSERQKIYLIEHER